MKNLAIAIHGGAGTILRTSLTPEKEEAYKAALQLALDQAYQLLENGASALDAVEKAVSVLEDSPLFNAGKGSVFTAEGTHEMDASIMDGSNLQAGAVSTVSGIKNPIQLARNVMDKSDHVFLCGKGAEEFAKAVRSKTETNDYFYDQLRYDQWQELKGSLKRNENTISHLQWLH